MHQDEKCVCGHLQSAHRTYGCTATKPNPSKSREKEPNRIFCQCKAFQAQKAAAAR